MGAIVQVHRLQNKWILLTPLGEISRGFESDIETKERNSGVTFGREQTVGANL